jgi:hypothetical protein
LISALFAGIALFAMAFFGVAASPPAPFTVTMLVEIA